LAGYVSLLLQQILHTFFRFTHTFE